MLRARALSSQAVTVAALLGAVFLCGCGGKEVSLGRGRAPQAGPSLGEALDPSAPANARDAFAGPAGAAPRPRIVYPLDGTMWGRNLGGLTLHWEAASGATIFRVRVRGPAGEARVFAGQPACTDGTRCQIYVPDGLWRSLGRAFAGATAQLAVEAVDQPGGAVAAGPSISITFSPEDLTGALTYWSTLNTGLVRQQLDGPPIPFLAQGSGPSGGRCVGCHVVSRDGCLTVAVAESAPPALVVTDPEGNDRRAAGDVSSVFQAISPDRRRLVTVAQGQATLREPDGRPIAPLPRALFGADDAAVAHVDWSPDGSFLVFTRLPAGTAPPQTELASAGDLVVLPLTAPDRFGPARVLVAHTAELRHQSPSISPDNRWVVFTSAAPDATGTYPAAQTRLRLVSIAGGTPIELTRASGAAPRWPRFAPFTQRSGQLQFVVFAAKRDYGFTVTQAEVAPAPRSPGGRAHLWIAALDLTRTPDPSFAPFWLPQQIAEHVNTLGFWARDLPVSAATCGF